MPVYLTRSQMIRVGFNDAKTARNSTPTTASGRELRNMADNRRGFMAGGSGYVSRMAYEVRANPMRPTGSPAMEPRLLLRLIPDLSWLMIAVSQTHSKVTKPAHFSGALQSRIPRIARRLRSRMNELGMNQTELAARCAGAAHDLFPEQLTSPITRERIAKILMHCKAHPGKSAARVISHLELQVLASVLQVSSEWLAGADDSRDLVLWDPLADPQRAHHILHLINEHEDNATEVLVWAEHLICSLETPEFMHRHHEALFSELDVLGAHDDKRRVVQIYDTIGNARRKRLFDSKRKRRKLIQFIFASDLERIVRGESEYAIIPQGVRRACLQNLCKMIADPGLGIDLVIVGDEAADEVRIAFRDYDSLGVFDESFVLWRYHSGRIAWSEHSGHARSHRHLLKKLQRSAIGGARDHALQILKRYVESITD
jgi:hypothetical protein